MTDSTQPCCVVGAAPTPIPTFKSFIQVFSFSTIIHLSHSVTMEPLVALALAGNVIQFVDFGRKLLSGSSELYRSSTGSLAANDEIELATADLKALINKLRRSFVPWSKNSTPNQHDQDTLASFRQVCDEAVKVADELVVRLSKLKVNSKHQTLSSLQQAVKSLWNAGEVAGLRNRLSSLKETLETHVIFSIRRVASHYLI